jgi:hypothetical protein
MFKAILDGVVARVALAMILASLAIAGVGFLLAALYLWCATLTSLPVAALVTGAVALAVAASPLLALWAQREPAHGRPAAPAQEGQRTESTEAAAMASALGAELGTLVANNPRTAVAGALLMGVVFGASPSARSGLRSLVESLGARRDPPG